MKQTINYKLPLWEANDITSWMTQLNNAMVKIDDTMHFLQLQSGIDGVPDAVVQAVHVLEQQVGEMQATVSRVPDLDTRLTALNQTVQTMAINLTNLDTRMETAENRLDNYLERIEKLEENYNTMNATIVALRNDVTTLQNTTNVLSNDYTALEARVTALEQNHTS